MVGCGLEKNLWEKKYNSVLACIHSVYTSYSCPREKLRRRSFFGQISEAKKTPNLSLRLNRSDAQLGEQILC